MNEGEQRDSINQQMLDDTQITPISEQGRDSINRKEDIYDDDKADKGSNEDEQDLDDMQRDGLTTRHIVAYALGHVCNDLCAAMWFFYLAWYLNVVVGLSKRVTALCGLSGQIADGIVTPIVGIASDSFDTRFGKRMPWYYFGALLVVPTFLGIFSYPEFINHFQDPEERSESAVNAWYITLPAIFNVGWASVQIANMSLVNQLSESNRKRDKLANLRNGFTYLSNILVLGLALIMFGTIDSEPTPQENSILSYRIMCYVSLALGGCCCLFYVGNMQEIKLSAQSKYYDEIYKKALYGDRNPSKLNLEPANKRWQDWFKEGTFYVHGIVYMVVRVALNVTQTARPYYLQRVVRFGLPELGTVGMRWNVIAAEQAGLHQENPTPVPLALVPLISYFCALNFSIFLQQPMTRCLRNRFLPMCVAICSILVGSIPLIFLTVESRWLCYPLAIFQNTGLAMMLNTSTSLISDVIGNDSKNSAIVYGFYSLLDKFANGIVLFIVVDHYSDNAGALRYIISFMPLAMACVALLFVWIGATYYSHKLAKITGIKTGGK